jgi:cytosine/adenosine deaminase-related metal-dependent hydrolase
MNNAVGYNQLLPRYENAVLGTDGTSLDMLEEFRFALFRHREAGGRWKAEDFLRCLDRGNRIMERYLGLALGRIVAGARADLVLWDYDPPTPLVGGNIAGHIAFGLSSRSVRSVMVEGRFVIEDRVPAFDADAIALKARGQAERLWRRMDEL